MIVTLVYLENDDIPLWVPEHPDVLAERIERADQDSMMRVVVLSANFDEEDEFVPRGIKEYTSYIRPRYVVYITPLGVGRRRQLEQLKSETS